MVFISFPVARIYSHAISVIAGIVDVEFKIKRVGVIVAERQHVEKGISRTEEKDFFSAIHRLYAEVLKPIGSEPSQTI